jgi:hypothetical protein
MFHRELASARRRSTAQYHQVKRDSPNPEDRAKNRRGQTLSAPAEKLLA